MTYLCKKVNADRKMNMESEMQKAAPAVVVERSYVAALAEGWRVAMNHIEQMARYLWPSALLTLVLPPVGAVFFAGQTDAVLKRWADEGAVPVADRKAMKREILCRTKRNVLSFFLLLLVAALMGAALVLPDVFGVNRLYGLGAACVLLVLLVPLDVCLMNISYTSQPLVWCLKSYASGWRHWGMLFAYDLVILLVAGLAVLIGALPLLVLAFVSGEASVARLAGDTVHLPMLYPALLALAYVLCMVVVLTVCVTCNFCRCLLWGALKAKAEREAAAVAVAEANVL